MVGFAVCDYTPLLLKQQEEANEMPARTRKLPVTGEGLWASLMELAEIGATAKGGVCRLAASDLDGAGRRLFIGWCEGAGCLVRGDEIGNILARPRGRPDPAAGDDRQSSRHPADRRQVRRRLWRDGGARGSAHPQ